MRRTQVHMVSHEMTETVCDLCETVIHSEPKDKPSSSLPFPMPQPSGTMALSYWPSSGGGSKGYLADVCEECVVTKVWPALEALGVRAITTSPDATTGGQS